MKIINVLAKRLPEILTGVVVGGIFASVTLAITATPKAVLLMDKEKEELGKDKLSVKDTVRVAWKCYVPTVISITITTACAIMANRESNKRYAALAAAYSLSETALKTYKAKVIETIGEKKEETIRDSIAKDKLIESSAANKEIIETGKGGTLCFDSMSGRVFFNDIEKIRKAEVTLNRSLYSAMFISLNEFYYEIGLPGIKLGDKLGWNVEQGPIEIVFSSQLLEDDRPCLVIDYMVAPRWDYKGA